MTVTRALLGAAIASLLTSTLYAHPSLTAHSHNGDTIKWEQDGTKDGVDAHNHKANRSFGGIGSPNRQPYNSSGLCWDNNVRRWTNVVTVFDQGHCFIKEDGTVMFNATYSFTGSWSGSAKARVRDAFAAWGAIATDETDLYTGIAFYEVSSGGNIEVKWADLLDADGGGLFFVDPMSSATSLTFDNDLEGSATWDFQKDPSGIAAGKWHFYSVALHEVGHAVGLAHQSDNDDLMKPPVGMPGGRFFTKPDSDSEIGVREVYSQPVGAPTLPSACTITLEYNGCINGYNPNYSVGVSDLTGAPGTSIVDLDYQRSGSWYDLADFHAGCTAAYLAIPNAFNVFRSLILTSEGVGECNLTVFIGSDQCNDLPAGVERERTAGGARYVIRQPDGRLTAASHGVAQEMLDRAERLGELIVWVTLGVPFQADLSKLAAEEVSAQSRMVERAAQTLVAPLMKDGSARPFGSEGLRVRGAGFRLAVDARALEYLIAHELVTQIADET